MDESDFELLSIDIANLSDPQTRKVARKLFSIVRRLVEIPIDLTQHDELGRVKLAEDEEAKH